MKLKVFNTGEAELINEFTSTVDLLGESPIQITGEGTIVVFYQDKETAKEFLISEAKRSITQLEKNLVTNEMNLMAFKIELDKAKDEAIAVTINAKQKLVDTALENVTIFTAKLEAYEAIVSAN